ncbi:MAG: EAL domain-containing protein [Chloroflexota bacterium]|nr:EAL domain-containing protein [Chloroflexota bacterium]
MKKILVIEDETNIRILIAAFLEQHNFNIIEAENGLVGLELARLHLPDLIICDISMPGMDGFDVLANLLQDSATATVPFIFVTAHTDRASFRRGMSLGADDFLTKPFTGSELYQAVEARLSRQQQLIQPYSSRVRRAEEETNRLQLYDSLTELPNQRYLIKELKKLLAQPDPTGLVLLHLQIDYQRISESLGRSFSHKVIKAVAERLVVVLKETNWWLAHLEAGQFILVYAGMQKNTTNLPNKAQILLNKLSTPYVVQGHELLVGVNIGGAIYVEENRDHENLLKQAQYALKQALQAGPNSYRFYNPALHTPSVGLLNLQVDLSYAVQRGELVLHYQPQIALQTGRITGVEVLLRWQHPRLGLLGPDKFIPLAEETGLIEPLGQWVLETACRQNRYWQLQYGWSLSVAINLPACQFYQPDLYELIASTLQRYKMEPAQLELELTETMLMQDPETAQATLYRLKELGIRLALDDFGIGYSSLNYLTQFPVDTLKIDRHFVQNLNSDAKNVAIIKTLIELAQRLNLKVVAEGVENIEQALFLKGEACTEGQGYLFARPMPAAKFEEYMRTNPILALPNTRPHHESYCKN